MSNRLSCTVTYEVGPVETVEEVIEGDPERVAQIIGDLDGDVQTLMMIFRDDGSHLAVGGGGCSGYVVYMTADNLTFNVAVDPTREPGSRVTLVTGRQPGDYDARRVVTAEIARRAATQFAENGTLSKEVTWEVE